MGRSKYVIGAIVDALGRVAVASEFVNIYSKATNYTLTGERYLTTEDPESAITDQFKYQLGIDENQFGALREGTSAKIDVGMNGMISRELHLYVYQISSPLTLKINHPSACPVRFLRLGEIKWLVENNKLKLSWAGKKMLEFLDDRKNGILKGVLN